MHFADQFDEPPQKPPRRAHSRSRGTGRVAALVVLALVVIGGIAYGVHVATSHGRGSALSTTTTAAPASTAAPTSTAANSGSTTTSPATTTPSTTTSSTTSTSTTSTTTSAPPTSTTLADLAPSQIAVVVYNGDGAAGQATATAAALRAQGFHIEGTANAANYGYVESEIQFGPGSEQAAETLARWLTGGTHLVEVETLKPNALNLILGSQYENRLS